MEQQMAEMSEALAAAMRAQMREAAALKDGGKCNLIRSLCS